MDEKQILASVFKMRLELVGKKSRNYLELIDIRLIFEHLRIYRASS